MDSAFCQERYQMIDLLIDLYYQQCSLFGNSDSVSLPLKSLFREVFDETLR
jgi:hypothetical protein